MKKSTLRSILVSLALAGTWSLAAACSSTPAPPASNASGRIIASQGGTVSDPTGTATLTIPAGALAKDTDITVSGLSASSSTLSPIFDFGPNGTTFSKPATLTIKVAASAIPAGQTATIGMGTGGAFTSLAGSSYANGVATAQVPHFTQFAVIGSGSSSTDGGTTSDTGGGGNCAFKGTYTMEKFLCGTTDVTSSWKSVIPTETLVVTDRAGGGCTMVLTHTAPACNEVESFDAIPVSGNEYTLSYKGISSCAPASCKFVQNDAACVVGDRVGTEPATLIAEGAKFHTKVTSSPGDLCGGQVADHTWAP